MINLIGGFAIGVLQKHMSFGDAVSTTACSPSATGWSPRSPRC